MMNEYEIEKNISEWVVVFAIQEGDMIKIL